MSNMFTSVFEEFRHTISLLKTQNLEDRDLEIRFSAIQEDIYFSKISTLEKFSLYYEMGIKPVFSMEASPYEEYFNYRFGQGLEKSLSELISREAGI